MKTREAAEVTPNPRTSRGEQAIAANQEAAFYETVPPTSLRDVEDYPVMARSMRAQANALLEPPAYLQLSAAARVSGVPFGDE